MAGRQRHVVDLGYIPGGDDVAARVGVVFQHVQRSRDLVNVPAVGGRPAAPLHTVNGAEFAVGGGPFVPNGDAVFVEEGDV